MIDALKREQQTIGEECAINDKLGLDLLAKLTEKVRPSEASKFRTYIDDVGHITSLLLSLSERLAQTEANLEMRPPSSQQEKVSSIRISSSSLLLIRFLPFCRARWKRNENASTSSWRRRNA